VHNDTHVFPTGKMLHDIPSSQIPEVVSTSEGVLPTSNDTSTAQLPKIVPSSEEVLPIGTDTVSEGQRRSSRPRRPPIWMENYVV
ncbi:hypothetical protein HAX54_030163, partial [Datura stramonium]|nr:hypothetical protein [Datura stramonium]